jgi:DNA polymerase III delta prime subunit
MKIENWKLKIKCLFLLMTSFIVVARDKEKRLTYAKEYCAKLQIDPFDITLIEQETTTKNTSSIGIEDVKNMQKKIFLKPFRGQTKAVIIEESHLLTTQAQNALLKVLEEPPAHTIMILSTQSKDSLLPTIISRCQVIELEDEKIEFTRRELTEYSEFIRKLPNLSIGECLKKAESLAKDKEKAMNWIEKLILSLREEVLKLYASSGAQARPKNEISGQVKAIKSLQKLHALLKSTNVNPRFAIEETLLKLM